MKRLIEETLIKCGMPVSVCGFYYSVEAILVLVKEPRLKMMAVYETVANRVYATPKAVERGIRYALSRTRKKGNPEMVQKYFGNGNSNSSTLKLLARHVNREMEETANETNG